MNTYVTTNGQSREDIKIVPRKVSFDWDGVTPEFIPGDPVTSHCINTLHIMFPMGENFFCRIFNEALPYLEDDPKLKADAIGFIRQEAMHSRSHQIVLDHYQALGYDVKTLADRFDMMVKRGGGDKVFGLVKPWNEKVRRWWLAERLMAVAAVEHFTCLMGVWMLENTALKEAGANDTMIDLLSWHCAEEVEHRNVAYDIAMYVSGNNQSQRYRAMIMTVPALYRFMRAGALYMMAQDPKLKGQKINFRKAWQSAAARNLVPDLRMLLQSTKRWFRRDYNPEVEAETQIALDYFAISPAAQAAEQRVLAASS